MKSMEGKFRARFCRRLCCSGPTDLESASLPLTEAAVDYFHDNMIAPEGLGRLDLSTASEISGHNGVSPCSMVMSVLYAKRLRHRNAKYLQSMSSSDIFFISMMMASKYLYDEGVEEEVFNDEWADVTGQEVEEVNQMELDFLDALDWQLYVRPEEFEDVLAALERRLALKEGFKRGWFTYTELAILLDSHLMYALWNEVGLDCSKMAVVLSTAYLASVISVIGSAAVAVYLSGPLTTATMAALSVQPSYLFGLGSSEVPAMAVTVPKSGFKLAIPNDVETNLSETLNLPREALPRQDNMQDGFSIQSENPTDSSAFSNIDEIHDEVNSDVEENKTECPSSKPARSSVLSLWFFDSLLSQILSVLEKKPLKQQSTCTDCHTKTTGTSSTDNSRCCEENAKRWRSCKLYHRCCHSKSSRQVNGIQRATETKHSRLLVSDDEFYKVGGFESHESGFESNQELPLVNSAPFDMTNANRIDLKSCHLSRPKFVTAKESIVLPSQRVHSFEQEDGSEKKGKNTAFLNIVLRQLWKLSSVFPARSVWDDSTFTGLPGSVLVT